MASFGFRGGQLEKLTATGTVNVAPWQLVFDVVSMLSTNGKVKFCAPDAALSVGWLATGIAYDV